MFGWDGISDHANWNEVFHYWDTKLSCKEKYFFFNGFIHKWKIAVRVGAGGLNERWKWNTIPF